MSAVSTVEARLASLEASLGIIPTTGPVHSPKDIDLRLDDLLSNAKAALPTSTGKVSAGGVERNTTTLDADMNQCDLLIEDLDPGTALSRQGISSSSAHSSAGATGVPMLYRRLDVLASADAMRTGMSQLGLAKDLLLLFPPSGTSGEKGGLLSSGLSEARGKPSATVHKEKCRNIENFTNSPIISSKIYSYASDPDARRRLHAVVLKIAELNARAHSAASRSDELVNRYHRIMSAVSEKMVLADEQLSKQRLV